MDNPLLWVLLMVSSAALKYSDCENIAKAYKNYDTWIADLAYPKSFLTTYTKYHNFEMLVGAENIKKMIILYDFPLGKTESISKNEFIVRLDSLDVVIPHPNTGFQLSCFVNEIYRSILIIGDEKYQNIELNDLSMKGLDIRIAHYLELIRYTKKVVQDKFYIPNFVQKDVRVARDDYTKLFITNISQIKHLPERYPLSSLNFLDIFSYINFFETRRWYMAKENYRNIVLGENAYTLFMEYVRRTILNNASVGFLDVLQNKLVELGNEWRKDSSFPFKMICDEWKSARDALSLERNKRSPSKKKKIYSTFSKSSNSLEKLSPFSKLQ